MPYHWINELWKVIGFGILAAFIGLLLGHVFEVLIVYVLFWFVIYFLNLVRFERWLREGKKYAPPVSRGLWGEMFTGIYHLQQRSRQRRKRLVQLLNRFRETTSAMPDGIVVLREQGDIEWWNETAEKLLGIKYPQDAGQRLTNLIRNPEFLAYYNQGAADEEVTIHSPGNEQLMLNTKIIPYGNNQKLVVIRDVSLIKKVERMRRDFVANISHELRTPLTVLSGYIENFLEEEKDKPGKEADSQVAHTLQVMQQQTKRMKQLTEDLILLSSIENQQQPRKSEIVNVPHLLANLQEQAGILSGDRDHTVLLKTQPDLFIRGDSKELDSTFTNLVVNAINYTPAGGTIRMNWYEDEYGAHFEVNDTGIGIAQHHIPRLTERFYRIDVARSRNMGGSGLGLAIVKHIMQRYQGALRIDSELGRGSTFICDFPTELIAYKSELQQQTTQ